MQGVSSMSEVVHFVVGCGEGGNRPTCIVKEVTCARCLEKYVLVLKQRIRQYELQMEEIRVDICETNDLVRSVEEQIDSVKDTQSLEGGE